MLGSVALIPFAALVHFAGHREAADFAAALRGSRARAPACAATLENPFTISNPGSFTRDERLRSRYSGLQYVPEGGWGGGFRIRHHRLRLWRLPGDGEGSDAATLRTTGVRDGL